MREMAKEPMCAAKGCKETIAPARLMCPVHWAMVPRPTAARVYRAWQNLTKRYSGQHRHDYQLARREAINAVARAEDIIDARVKRLAAERTS